MNGYIDYHFTNLIEWRYILATVHNLYITRMKSCSKASIVIIGDTCKIKTLKIVFGCVA